MNLKIVWKKVLEKVLDIQNLVKILQRFDREIFSIIQFWGISDWSKSITVQEQI